MSTLVSFVNEVEDAVASGDPVRRVEALRRMTNLFIEQAPHLKELHVTVFDEVILRLSRDLEFRTRMELSERLAEVANAPQKVVRDLAFDENIAVAGPVLERSSRLAEDDLVTLARDRGQEHLLALSRRASLSERVTDILVDRGDRQVVHSVAGNEGARFSSGGLQQLLDRAREDETLQAVLQARRDIPGPELARLVEIAREKVRESMQAEFGGIDGRIIDETIEEAAEGLARRGRTRALVDNFEEALATVARRARASSLTEGDVADWVREGRIEEAICAMAQIANVPVGMVARAYHSSHYDPLLFIVRSLRFGWPTFKLILTAKSGRQPPADVLKKAFEGFQRLSVPTALRVVKFNAVRERSLQPDAA